MNHRISLPMLAGITLVLCGASALAFAPTGGRVMTVIGSADILRDQATIPAEKGGVLQSGDLLKTPVDGRLQWWMEDDSMVAMASSSQVHIRRFEPDANEATYTLQSGAMRIISGSVHPAVLTPLAKVTALGTDFSMFMCGTSCSGQGNGQGNGQGSGQGQGNGADGKNARVLYVRVDTGRVRVQNAAGSVDASSGQIVYVASPNSPPSIIPQAPVIMVQASLELEFDVGAGDFIPDVPVQPIPPGEQPGSPS
ncbi:MAG: FecR domain-containing protein [Sinimarinibacterium sp.]|jgi:hypothetical protein